MTNVSVGRDGLTIMVLGANFCLLTSLSFVCRGQGGELAATRSALQCRGLGSGDASKSSRLGIGALRLDLHGRAFCAHACSNYRNPTDSIAHAAGLARSRRDDSCHFLSSGVCWETGRKLASHLSFLSFFLERTDAFFTPVPSAESRQSAFFFLSTSVSLG